MKTETENLRELDQWIAKKVFGWFDIGWSQSSYEFPEEPPPRFLRGHLDGGLWREIPHYSTDPAAAMQVLEKCCKFLSPDGGGNAVAAEWNGDVEESWRVVETDCADCTEAEAPTLPIAICKFAKALYSK